MTDNVTPITPPESKPSRLANLPVICAAVTTIVGVGAYFIGKKVGKDEILAQFAEDVIKGALDAATDKVV
jgi:hypothetical protein